jgi:hypothetical protein
VKIHSAIAALVLLLPLVASAETFRCGQWVINEETTIEELTHKCGAPTSRTSRVEDVRARSINGGMEKVGETVIETWVYDRGSRAAPMTVTIVDGKVKSVERLKK